MKSKELPQPSCVRSNKLVTIILCQLMFLGGCSDFQFAEEDRATTPEEKPLPQAAGEKVENTEAMIPKALHDDLMAEQEVLCQELNTDLQKIQTERDKLLADLATFGALKQDLATSQEARKQILAESAEYKASSQAAASASGAASAKTIQQLTASNTQLTQDLATSKQRAEQLEQTVGRMQNPANMLKIKQLTLEKEFISKELAERDEKIKELKTSLSTPTYQENLKIISQLKVQNTSLSRSLARSEKKFKDLQATQDKPIPQVDPNLIKQLQSKNAKLSAELSKLKQQLAARPKDSVKTLAEWKNKLRNQGLMNIKPSTAQLTAAIGKQPDEQSQTSSGDGDGVIFTWHDSVKVDFEIHAIDGKIETITFSK